MDINPCLTYSMDRNNLRYQDLKDDFTVINYSEIIYGRTEEKLRNPKMRVVSEKKQTLPWKMKN